MKINIISSIICFLAVLLFSCNNSTSSSTNEYGNWSFDTISQSRANFTKEPYVNIRITGAAINDQATVPISGHFCVTNDSIYFCIKRNRAASIEKFTDTLFIEVKDYKNNFYTFLVNNQLVINQPEINSDSILRSVFSRGQFLSFKTNAKVGELETKYTFDIENANHFDKAIEKLNNYNKN